VPSAVASYTYESLATLCVARHLVDVMSVTRVPGRRAARTCSTRRARHLVDVSCVHIYLVDVSRLPGRRVELDTWLTCRSYLLDASRSPPGRRVVCTC
jgi:hypothetical protein